MQALEEMVGQHGSLAALVSLILLKMGEWVFNYYKKKNELTETTLKALRADLERNTNNLIATQHEIKKLRTDMRHAFFALKELAGKAWPDIADKIEEYNRKERGNT